MSNDALRLDIGRHHDMTLVDIMTKLLEGGNFAEGLWRSYKSGASSPSGATERTETERRAYIAGAVGLWFFVNEVITSNTIDAEQRGRLLAMIRDQMAEAGSEVADLLQASRPNH